MGKKLLFAFVLLLSAACVMAQNTPVNLENVKIAGPAFRHSNPLMVINADDRTAVILPATTTSHSFSTTLDEINANWVQSITVLNDQDAVEKYGTMGRYGAIVLELKKGSLDKMPSHLAERFKEK